jgi:purine-binding chemotaxis protein CheW
MTENALVREPGEARHGAVPGPGATAGLDSVVCFAVAGKIYALDVAVVREVVGIDKLLPVPRTPAPIVGAFALRGATMALVDSRILFGLEAAVAATTALVVVRGHRTICGLTIDRVVGVARFVEAKFTPAVRGREPSQIAGFMADERGGLLTVLDTPTILQSLESLRF